MPYPKDFIVNFEKANNGDINGFNKLIEAGCFTLQNRNYHGCMWASEAHYECKTRNFEIWKEMRERLLSDKSLRKYIIEDENSEYYFDMTLEELEDLPF